MNRRASSTPVEDQAAGHDRQRRDAAAVLLGPRTAGLEQGQDLHRLAQAHVVGQAAAEAEVAQEVQPAQPVLLIVAQPAAEPARLLASCDALEGSQLATDVGELPIDGHVLLRRQKRVEQ